MSSIVGAKLKAICPDGAGLFGAIFIFWLQVVECQEQNLLLVANNCSKHNCRFWSDSGNVMRVREMLRHVNRLVYKTICVIISVWQKSGKKAPMEMNVHKH